VKAAGALSIVDDAIEAVRAAPAWVGLLWITALPSRLLFAFAAARLIELGPDAVRYGTWIRSIASLWVLLWLLSLWGRQVFVRASRHALDSERPPPRVLLRVPLGELAGHVSSAAAVEVAFWLLLVTFIAPAFLLLASGLAAVAAPAGGPGPLDSLRELWRGIGPVGRLIRLLALFAIAAAAAAINLHLFTVAALWAAEGIPSLDLTTWRGVVSLHHPPYAILVATGALLLVEPAWIAALTAHVERVRARSSGEDLRRWFEELRARS
jgi:hypothetical protein